ncbi:hypothetical protein GIB67_001711 [Kingdonia uniflora]|uniref:MTTase N-terminal domain-containing protein n=1 Tax=Kingdonia uniflora TaxID=39325 RepID=A0A7J7LMQ1_9MAGN|nr:hypothetical protein GIB67_001711 [Kingdonia uniflora]
MDTLIVKCKSTKKPLVVAGCVPQGSRDLRELKRVSVVRVQQIDRVVEVFEVTLKGHEVLALTARQSMPVGIWEAIILIIKSLVERIINVVADGVKEIWISSEDTGAYGHDIGVNLPILLKAIVAQLPSDRNTMF